MPVFSSVVDLAFYLGANRDPGSQTNADPDLDPGQAFNHKKFNFCMKNILNRSKDSVPK
jgi:hypothetical protein